MTYDERRLMLERIKKLEEKNKQEMDALWIHIRNLELLLLNPVEVPDTKKEWKLDI